MSAMTAPDRLAAHRSFFAQLVSASAGVPPTETRIREAFAAIPRERFVGAGPWHVFTRAGYIQTPNDDPAFLYQDVPIALKREEQINNGQPTLHAACLAALAVKPGETAVHVGAGTGYYTALLARLTGPDGAVHAYEIHPKLAPGPAAGGRAWGCHREHGARAGGFPGASPTVCAPPRTGTGGASPACDVLYVNAGAAAQLDGWVDALGPGGRLLFPLTSAAGPGA